MASTGEAVALRRTVGLAFELQPNALNFIRLCLALEVLVWHSYSLRGSAWLSVRAESFLADIAVDSFFAISGFLIVRAWHRRPDATQFLLARGKRILPGLWACLAVTAFVIAPLTAHVTGVRAPAWDGRWHYVVANAFVRVGEWGVEGSPGGVAYHGVWNGSLWSLWFEAICYAAVLLAGVLRLLRLPVVAGTAIAMWFLSATGSVGVLYGRTWLMFSCGAVLYLVGRWVPLSGRLAATSVALVAVAAVVLPGDLSYRTVAAPAVAYLSLYGGLLLGRFRLLQVRQDFSYGTYVYAFPVQQALLVCGVSAGWVGFAVLSIVSTLPLAVGSWFLVERPALRGRRRSLVHPMAPTGERGAGQVDELSVKVRGRR